MNLKEYDKIVVMIPHPDDEVIGCSSILLDKELKDKLCLIYVTDGCFYNYPTIRSQEARTTRKNELENLCRDLQLKHFYCAVRDTHTNEILEETGKTQLIRLINEVHEYFDLRPDENIVFFVPYQNDKHEDHKSTFLLAKEFIKAIRPNKPIIQYQYEVWTPIQNPTHYLKVQPDDKATLLTEYYPSQVTNVPYVEGILGLNRYRGLQLLKHGYYEAFEQLS